MFDTLATFDASIHMEKLANKPLFFWHGEKDTIVPFESTAHFIEAFEKQYGNEHINLYERKISRTCSSRKGLLTATNGLQTIWHNDGSLL